MTLAIRWILLSTVFLSMVQICLETRQIYCKNLPLKSDGIKKVVLNCKAQPLRSVLDEIKTQTGVSFIYQDNLIDDILITCKIDDSSVDGAVKKILKGRDISYKIFGENSFVLFKKEKIAVPHYEATVIEQIGLSTDTIRIMSNPIMITKGDLVYPADAVRNNIEGKVGVNLFVTKEGNVLKALVQNSSGFSILDSAAIEHSRNLKFIPAKIDSEPRDSWTAMIFKYLIVDKK